MDLVKIVAAFNKWYQNDPHSADEDYYQATFTYEYLHELSKEGFIEYFYNFADEGGKVQSGGDRTKDRFRDNIFNNYEDFRRNILEIFSETFDLESWLGWADSFPYLGQGLATIILNRKDKYKYAIVNKKSINGLKVLGYDIKKSGALYQKYIAIYNAEKELLNQFPELENFYIIDAMMHFLIGTPEGRAVSGYESVMEYFNIEQLIELKEHFNKSYEKNSPATACFKETRLTLGHFVKLLGTELNEELIEVYNEKPDNAAREKKLKNYILKGFVPSFFPSDTNLFIKIAFHNLDSEDVHFDIEFDQDNKKPNKPYHSWLTVNRHRLRIKVDSDFPKDWDELIELIGQHVNELINILKTMSEENLNITESTDQNNSNPNKNKTLNQILYGPPGTGKTYSTISRAVAIIENKKPEVVEAEAETNFTHLKSRYDKYVNEGKIVFTTFHQSMAYEDFIEGIKPKMPESEDEVEDESAIGGLNYVIEDGIFKQLCNDARKKEIQEYDFDQLWSSFATHILNSIEEVVFTSVSSEIKLEKELSTLNSLKIRFKKSWDINESQGTKIFQVGKEPMRKLFDARIDVSNPKENKWGEVKNILSAGRATTYYAVYRSFFQHANLADLFNKKDGLKPHVLIIDEINRGNISQIFGELITLIEDDKREDRKAELHVTLPYSKKPFSVPDNVYIIGTMNTADRSVEALDTALRRRFSFVPKMPDEDKLTAVFDGIELSKLLRSINERLRILKDNDHTIGHAWLMGISDFDGLKKVFTDKILPLLQEYFYNDYEKLGLVLGEAFFDDALSVKKESFAAFKIGEELASRYYDIKKLTLKEPKNWTKDDFLQIYIK